MLNHNNKIFTLRKRSYTAIIHSRPNMGNLKMLCTLILFPQDRGTKGKKEALQNEEKRKVKACGIIFWSSVPGEIFNIEDHALSHTSKAVLLVALLILSFLTPPRCRFIITNLSLSLLSPPLSLIGSPYSLSVSLFLFVAVLVVSRACTLGHMKFHAAPFLQ